MRKFGNDLTIEIDATEKDFEFGSVGGCWPLNKSLHAGRIETDVSLIHKKTQILD